MIEAVIEEYDPYVTISVYPSTHQTYQEIVITSKSRQLVVEQELRNRYPGSDLQIQQGKNPGNFQSQNGPLYDVEKIEEL